MARNRQKRQTPPALVAQSAQGAKVRQTPRAHECPICYQLHRPDHGGRSATERVLSIQEHPLVEHVRFMVRDGDEGQPALGDRFVAWLDHDRTPRQERRQAVVDLARAFAQGRPILAMLVVKSVLEGHSNRGIAEELGVDDHTVAKMLQRGWLIVRQMAAEQRIYD